MEIRTANIMDIEKILHLEKQIIELHMNARPDWFGGKSPLNHDFIKSIIEGDNGIIFVAETENEIIGYCFASIHEIKNHDVFHDMKYVEIDDLCVDEKCRQKGIGRKLFEKVKIFAKEREAKIIELSVWEFNQNAIKFYENLGMKTRINKMELKIE
jgi:ribosomal protein S18 acetylase RimI-like enzyme